MQHYAEFKIDEILSILCQSVPDLQPGGKKSVDLLGRAAKAPFSTI